MAVWLRLQPLGGVESLENVRIPIWSTKCISARWFGPAAPLVDSELQPMGTDRLEGTITNRLRACPLEDRRSSPTARKSIATSARSSPPLRFEVELSARPQPFSRLRDMQSGYYDPQTQYLTTQVNIDRYKLEREIHSREEQYVEAVSPLATQRRSCYLTISQATPTLDRPMLLGNVGRLQPDLDLSGHLALDRPPCSSRINRTGDSAGSCSDKTPATPEQKDRSVMTLVRIIHAAQERKNRKAPNPDDRETHEPIKDVR